MEVVALIVPRRAVITQAEMETPDEPRRGVVTWIELSIPDAIGTPGLTFADNASLAAEAAAGWAVIAASPVLSPEHPYIQALAAALKGMAESGQPLIVDSVATIGTVPKFITQSRVGDSLFSDDGVVATVGKDLSVLGNQTVGGGILTLDAGTSSIIVSVIEGPADDPVIEFFVTDALRAVIGIAAVAGDLLAGSAFGDLILRTQGSNLRVSLDSGSTTAFIVAPDGVNTPGVYKVSNLQVIGPRIQGYLAMSGNANRGTAYATSTITLVQLAERVKALQDDNMAHGFIGV